MRPTPNAIPRRRTTRKSTKIYGVRFEKMTRFHSTKVIKYHPVVLSTEETPPITEKHYNQYTTTTITSHIVLWHSTHVRGNLPKIP